MTRPSPRSPDRRRPTLPVALALAAAVVLVGGGAGLWYLFLRPSGPPPVDLSALATPSPPATIAAASPASATSPGSAASSPSAGTSGGGAALDGTWKVDPSIGSGDTGSFVGYRIQEQLAGIGAQTAVGRTSSVSGTFTLAGTTIASGSITADLTSLRSDDSRRDGQLAGRGLETSTYPTATFTLTKPIELGSIPAAGTIVKVKATGDLKLHGQARSVTIELQAKISNGVIAVAGSLPIVLADYGMSAPTSFIALSVAGDATMEFQLMFTRG